MASSTSNSGVLLPDGRTFPLGPDALFFLTLQFGGLPPILNNYVGALDPQGTAAATVVVPTATPPSSD